AVERDDAHVRAWLVDEDVRHPAPIAGSVRGVNLRGAIAGAGFHRPHCAIGSRVISAVRSVPRCRRCSSGGGAPTWSCARGTGGGTALHSASSRRAAPAGGPE